MRRVVNGDCLGIKQIRGAQFPMSFKVRIAQADRTVEVPTGATILEAALDAGLSYPFGCQSGNCGACKSHLVKGEVTMQGYSEFALSDDGEGPRPDPGLPRRALGGMRGRLARVEDDLVVHPRSPADLQGDRSSTMPRTTSSACAWRSLSGGPFDFAAGQFASVTFDGCPPRDYSMANVPGDPILEFHVRRTAGGATSLHVSERLKVGDSVRVEGPVRRVLPARHPSRADHRRRRRLGHGADQGDRRAGPAEESAATHLPATSASAPSETSTCTTISPRWPTATRTFTSFRC